MKKEWPRFFCLFSMGFFFNVETKSYDKNEWTWAIPQKFDETTRILNQNNEPLLVERFNLPPFSQLIFSWNAIRPQSGFLRFFVRVRDACTKKWHKWHTAADWGFGVQKSYADKPETGSQWHHVRLEMPSGSTADAFSLKIASIGGATLAELQSVLISISDLNKFASEDYEALAQLPSVAVSGVPAFSQMILEHPKGNVMCSPTSCAMLTTFLSQQTVDPLGFALNAYDDGLGAYGSWPFNIAHAFEKLGHARHIHVVRLPSFSVLHRFLQRGIPVVVSVRGFIEGAVKPYESGHLLVVRGWDAARRKVLCHDPAFPNAEMVPVEYDLKEFCSAWERSRRLAYCVDL